MEPLILIIDDTKLGRLSVKKSLYSLGITQIDELADGSMVLNQLEQKEYSLVLMDILMPGQNGMDLLKKIRESGYDTAVVMISADIQETTKKRCLQNGANGFLNKPVKRDLLQQTLEELKIL